MIPWPLWNYTLNDEPDAAVCILNNTLNPEPHAAGRIFNNTKITELYAEEYPDHFLIIP